MSNAPVKFLNESLRFGRDERGITGLETAIVLIAFVVVSSVFAFATLSTVLFSSDKAKETISAGLAEARGTLELKGSVIVKASATTGASGVVSSILFQVSNAAAGESVDMTPGNTVIKCGSTPHRWRCGVPWSSPWSTTCWMRPIRTGGWM